MTLTSEQTVVACLVLHVLADFPLQTLGQPRLADLQQKAWWIDAIDRLAGRPSLDNPERRRQIREQATRKYGDDYKAALWCHSIVWAALTFLPLCTVPGWSAIVAANAWIHYLVDDLKANHLKINLATDQALHGWQIGLTVGGYFFVKFLMGG